MNFSENFKLTSKSPPPPSSHSSSPSSHPLVKFSPDARHVANAVQHRVIVRDAQNTLQVTHLFTCLDAVQTLEWSHDSELILCAMYKRGLIQIWSLEQPEWSCKIDEGSAGLVSHSWSPDSRHVLTTADFDIRLTVWSLTSKQVAYIKHASKARASAIHFSGDGRYMALAERRDCKDSLSIFDLSSWSLVKHFAVETRELAGVLWKPGVSEHALVIWESVVFGFDLIMYSLSGHLLGRFNCDDFPSSALQANKGTSLGASMVVFSPCGQLLGCACSDPRRPSVLLLNSLTWSRVADLAMTSSLHVGHNEKDAKQKAPLAHRSTVVYQEVNKKVPVALDPRHPLASSDVASLGTLYASRSRFEPLTAGHVTIPSVAFDPEKSLPSPLTRLHFSPDSLFVAARSEALPTALWIWDVKSLSLCSVLVVTSGIKCFSWAPASPPSDPPSLRSPSPRLAVVTGNQNLYMWTTGGALSVQVPTDVAMDLSSLSWSPDGTSVILAGRDAFCLCFCLEKEVLAPGDATEADE